MSFDTKLKETQARIEKGGALKYHAKNKETGKLFARDRLALLLDRGGEGEGHGVLAMGPKSPESLACRVRSWCPQSTISWASGRRSASCSATARPLPSGRSRSRIIRSGGSSRQIARASEKGQGLRNKAKDSENGNGCSNQNGPISLVSPAG